MLFFDSINNKDAMADFIMLNMVEFDVILGMDWLHAYYATIDCRTQVVKFRTPNKLFLE